MSKKLSEKESICLERCYFFAENCRQKEDGTWDCKSGPEYCEEHCHGKS
jgi:hypothetical protein